MVSTKGSAKKAVESDADSVVRNEFQSLCRELNMDSATTTAAWDSYVAIKQNYTLEGSQLHWLACALYVACHNSYVPTVGESGATAAVIEGNGVSLTRLLRCAKLSLIHFFNKAKKWADMANLTSQFRKKIDGLERNFAVCSVIFKKYGPIFVYLFKEPAREGVKVNRSRKQKKPPCTASEVFDFCWTLFIRVKTDFPAISDDLVNSFHLLLSCVDYVYGNAVVDKRTDLLNDTYKVPEGASSLDPPCILDSLCAHHDGIIAEVKSIKAHWWRPHIRKFFEQKILRGATDGLCGILDPAHFDNNCKNVRKDYEAYVLSIGEYDERIFLGEDAPEEIGTPSKLPVPAGADKLGEQPSRRPFAMNFDGSNLIPTTPLSGKQFLRSKEQLKITPVSTATYLVSRLNNLLCKRGAEPSPRLLELFKSCDIDPTESVADRVRLMGDTFCQRYTAATDKHPGSHDSFARMRNRMAVALYYKLLEAILYAEKKKNGSMLANLLSQELFHKALFTCCLEIVIFSYNSQRTFPWILETFELEAMHFYKVIEIIIRNEDSLARDVVKHLQRIEEQVLESRAWTKDSSLWALLQKDPQGVPTCEEVSLPGQGMGGAIQVGGGHIITPGSTTLMDSPLSHHKRPFSVKSPMAADRFKSPVVTAVARRQLAFGDNENQIVPTSPIRAGQSLLSSPQKTVIQLQGGDLLTPDASGNVTKAKRPGSLGLFFRKVYHLAHLRLDLLCQTLSIPEEEKRKIFTTFEHTLVKHTDLMKDRHLDQLLMCSLYIVCKVVGQNKNFTDIMKHYKEQPQAVSHVYRSVLLGPKKMPALLAVEDSDPAGRAPLRPPPTPTRVAGSSSMVAGEERGDLIKFYNSTYMTRLQEFSLRFKRSRVAEAPPLSPLPKLRAHPQSPCRKVSDNHSVFIRPLKATPGDVVSFNPQSPHKPLSYSFSRSPAKDLAAINALMRVEVEKKSLTRKRLLADEPEFELASAENISQDETQMILVQEGDGPPVKMQIVQAGMGAAPATSGAVNTKLELILGDRNAQGQ